MQSEQISTQQKKMASSSSKIKTMRRRVKPTEVACSYTKQHADGPGFMVDHFPRKEHQTGPNGASQEDVSPSKTAQHILNETGQTCPPSDKGQTYPPSETGQTYPPSETGQTYPPSETGHTYPPSETGQTYPSSETGQTYPPSEMGQTYPPSETSQHLLNETGQTHPPIATRQTYPPSEAGQHLLNATGLTHPPRETDPPRETGQHLLNETGLTHPPSETDPQRETGQHLLNKSGQESRLKNDTVVDMEDGHAYSYDRYLFMESDDDDRDPDYTFTETELAEAEDSTSVDSDCSSRERKRKTFMEELGCYKKARKSYSELNFDEHVSDSELSDIINEQSAPAIEMGEGNILESKTDQLPQGEGSLLKRKTVDQLPEFNSEKDTVDSGHKPTFGLLPKGQKKEGCKQIYDKENVCTFCGQHLLNATGLTHPPRETDPPRETGQHLLNKSGQESRLKNDTGGSGRKRWSKAENECLAKKFKFYFEGRKKTIHKSDLEELQRLCPSLADRTLPQIRAKLNNVKLGKCTLY